MYGVFATDPRRLFYWEADKDKGSGATSEGDAKTDPEQGEVKPDDSATGQGGEPSDDKKFTQAELDKIIQRRLNEQSASFEKQKLEAEAEARRQEQEKAGEWETLYRNTLTQVEELKASLSTHEKLSTFVGQHIDSTIKAWPQELRDTDPGTENVTARLEWMQKSTGLAQRLLQTAPPSGEHQTPKGSVDRSSAADKFLASRYTRPDSKP